MVEYLSIFIEQLSTFVEYTWECMKLPNVASSDAVLEER